MQVILDSLVGTTADKKLIFQGLTFVNWVALYVPIRELMFTYFSCRGQVFRQAEEKFLIPIAPSILTVLLRIFDMVQVDSPLHTDTCPNSLVNSSIG